MENTHTIPWKNYIIATAKCVIAFYLATFALALYLLHSKTIVSIETGMLCVLYLFVIYVCSRIIAKTFSLAAIMLLIPIIPLIALILVVTSLPILEKLI